MIHPVLVGPGLRLFPTSGPYSRLALLDSTITTTGVMIVIGGGVSKNSDKFIPKLKLNAEVVPAKLLNTAGIVGAAWLAADRQIHPDALR